MPTLIAKRVQQQVELMKSSGFSVHKHEDSVNITIYHLSGEKIELNKSPSVSILDEAQKLRRHNPELSEADCRLAVALRYVEHLEWPEIDYQTLCTSMPAYTPEADVEALIAIIESGADKLGIELGVCESGKVSHEVITKG